MGTAMSEQEVWTVGRLLQWTTDYFKQRGADTPRLDAELLLAHALGCQRIDLYTSFHRVPDEAQRAEFRRLVSARAAGTPVAYLLQTREFFSLEFRVTADVLIPRPETELLVVRLLELARRRDATADRQPLEIADVGTGSGCIAVSAARHLPDARITAIDISPAALAVARENALRHEVAERIELVESDLFSAVDPRRRFDFVVSNPPYVGQHEIDQLAPEVRDHEPRVALVAGPRGTEVIERLIPQAAERLRPGGHLLMEINPMLHEQIVELFEARPELHTGPTIRDLARLPRVVEAVKRAELAGDSQAASEARA